MFRVIAKVIAQNAALGVFQAVGKRDIPPDMIDINRKAQIGRPDLGADRQRIADAPGPAACGVSGGVPGLETGRGGVAGIGLNHRIGIARKLVDRPDDQVGLGVIGKG